MSQLSFNRFKLNQNLSRHRPSRTIERRNIELLTYQGAEHRNRQEFLNWRANWRKGYKIIVFQIKNLKTASRDPSTDEAARRQAMGSLQVQRAMARSMMMGLEAAKAHYEATRVPYAERTISAGREPLKLHNVEEVETSETETVEAEQQKLLNQ